MRRRHAVAAGVAGLAAGAATLALPASAAPAHPGQAVVWPEIELLEGGRWGAADAHGKAVVVVFWSVTCPYCQRHNAHVEKLRREAAGKGLVVLGVARERDAESVRRTMVRHGWQFAVTLDEPPMARALSTRRIVPLTVTVDRGGRLKQVIPGEMFEADVLELLQLAA